MNLEFAIKEKFVHLPTSCVFRCLSVCMCRYWLYDLPD